MKYGTHGNLTVDTWRKMISFNDINMKKPRDKAIIAAVKDYQKRDEFNLVATVAGFATVAAVYAAVPILVASDGPLPFGDAIAVGLLAIPDAAIFAFGYELFD